MKLKEIPENIVVHTPTEQEARELLAILHENGWTWNIGQSLIEKTRWYNADSCYCLHPDRLYVTWSNILDKNFLTFSEFKSKYCEEEEPQPKFKVDDIVAIRWINKWGRITNVHFSEEAEEWEYNVKVYPKGLATALESYLEPYTEPETKPTEDMETKEKRQGEKGNNSENSLLDLCELIGDRDGIRVYCPTCGEVTLQAWDRGKNTKPLIFAQTDTSIVVRVFANGKAYAGGECVIFPSRALYEQYPLDPYTAWMKWQEEHKKYPMTVVCYDSLSSDKCELLERDIYFRTPADRDKCIEEIKAIIGKYSKK